MNEKNAFVLLVSKKLLLIDSPNLLLESTPTDLLNKANNNAKPSGFFWGYIDKQGKKIITQFSWMVPDISEDENEPYLIVIDPDFASTIGIQPGSKVTYTVEQNNLIVCKINGKPIGTLPSTSRASYSTRMIPLDNWGFLSMRAFCLLAPVGFGGCFYLVAPGRSGKTSVLLDLWESLLRLTNILPSLYVIFIVVGERKEDADLYLQVQEMVDHDKNRVEFYSAASPSIKTIQKMPSIKIYQGQWMLFEYISKQRVTSLAEQYDCFYGIDSLHRAAAAHSWGGLALNPEGKMGGGFTTESMLEAILTIQIAGNLGPDTSLTVMSSLIGNYKRTHGKPSVLEGISLETSDHVPTGIWSLVSNPMSDYPKIDVTNTHTRRVEQFAFPKWYKENIAVDNLMWDYDENRISTNKPDQAHKILLDYCRSKLIPDWANDPTLTPITPAHLKLMGFDSFNHDNNSIAHLTSSAMGAKIIELSQRTGLSKKQILDNALDLYAQSLLFDLNTQREVKFFLGTKPGDEFGEVTLRPEVRIRKI